MRYNLVTLKKVSFKRTPWKSVTTMTLLFGLLRIVLIYPSYPSAVINRNPFILKSDSGREIV